MADKYALRRSDIGPGPNRSDAEVKPHRSLNKMATLRISAGLSMDNSPDTIRSTKSGDKYRFNTVSVSMRFKLSTSRSRAFNDKRFFTMLVSSWALNGFPRNASAPNCVPINLLSSSLFAVNNTTGTDRSVSSAFTASMSSEPLITGIIQSVTMSSGCSSRARCKPSLPLAA